MQYLGDFSEDATVYIPFNTFSSNDPQASVTATTLANTDIYVHKDGSITDIVTDGATVVIDFDGIAGNHLLTIDTSASADYSIGSDYLVRIEGMTVDAGLVNAIVGSFSIENRYNDVNVVTVSGTAQTANDNGADINTLLTRIVGTLATGTHNPATAAQIAVLSDWINGGRLDLLLDAIPTTAMRGTDNAGLASELAKVPKSDSTVSWNATALASINAEADTALTDYGANTTTPLNAAGVRAALGLATANMDTQFAASTTATGFATEVKQDAQDLIITETRLAELDAANLPANVDDLKLGIIFGTAATGTLSTTVATSDLTGYADDQLIGRVIIWTSGACDGEGADITDYASLNGTLTFTALTTAPANTDTFKIV